MRVLETDGSDYSNETRDTVALVYYNEMNTYQSSPLLGTHMNGLCPK